MAIPPAVDAALLALGRQAGLSSVLRAQEMALDREVLMQFEGSPAPSNVASVLETLRQCLELARSGKLSAGDQAELPGLEKLAALLQELTAPRPAPEPPTRPVSPTPGPTPVPSKSTAPSPVRALCANVSETATTRPVRSRSSAHSGSTGSSSPSTSSRTFSRVSR